MPRPAVASIAGKQDKAILVVHEDGVAELWNSGPPDRLPNIYLQSNEELLHSFSDLIYAAAVEEGALYIENLVEEVDAHATHRAKMISSATFFNKNMLSEARTRLYVSIRIIQDRLKQGKMAWGQQLKSLPPELQAAIRNSRKDLIRLFKQSDHTIVEDYLERADLTLENLLALDSYIQLGQFQLDISKAREKIANSQNISPELKAEYMRRTQPK